MTGIYFLILAFESGLLSWHYFTAGSASSEQVFAGLSPQKLALVSLLAGLALVFSILAGMSASRNSKFRRLLNDLLESERKIWRLFGASLCSGLFAAMLLIAGAQRFGDYRAVYIQFQPVFSWIFWISLQTMLVLLVWSALRFNTLKADAGSSANREAGTIWLIFSISVAVKLLWGVRGVYGPVNGDEMEYFSLAYYLGAGSLFRAVDPIHYPPLYPLFLTSLIPFGLRAFDLIKIMNVLLSSSIVFPIYLTARQNLDARRSAWAAAAACLLPFHLVFPRRIQSENLYFPLFCWAQYMLSAYPKQPHRRTGWDALSGACLGALYLTRYITLAILPAFLLAWWLKNERAEDSKAGFSTNKMLRLALLFASSMIVYAPWVLAGMRAGFAFKDMLGLFITGQVENPAQLDFAHLLKWVLIYGAYLILMAAPVLPLVISVIPHVFSSECKRAIRHWFPTTGALVGLYSAAVVRHSWRANYNAELPMKIMGRYLIFLAPIFLISAMLSLAEMEKQGRQPNWKIILSIFIIPTLMILSAYLIVVQKTMLPIHPQALNELGAVDGYLVSLLDWRFFAILLPDYLASALALARSKFKSHMLILSLGLCAFYLLRLPAYYSILQPEQTYSQTGAQIAGALVERYPQEYRERDFDLLLPNRLTSAEKQLVYFSVQVRGFFELTPASYNSANVFEEISAGTLILWEDNEPWISAMKADAIIDLNGQDFQLLIFD